MIHIFLQIEEAKMKTILCVYFLYTSGYASFVYPFGYKVQSKLLRGELNRMISMSHNVQYFLLSQHTFRSLRKFAKNPYSFDSIYIYGNWTKCGCRLYLRWKNVCFYRRNWLKRVEGEIYPFRDNLNYEFCKKKK